MKTIISRKNLNIRITSHDGEVKAYSVNLEDCNLNVEERDKVFSLTNELRSILRSEQNLQEAIEFIESLESNLKNEDRYGLNISNRSLFISAVILYGACFVKGGAENKIPLNGLKDMFKNEKIHNDIMIYRHKLLSHLDEDHDVRTDKLGWDLSVQGEKILPQGPHLNGSKVMMEMGLKNVLWIEHMRMLICEINKRKLEITNIVNELLGDIQIE